MTLIAHGHAASGAPLGWVASMADAIAGRLPGNTSIWTLQVGEGIQASRDPGSPDRFAEDYNGESIIKLDWSAAQDLSRSTVQVASAVADYLLTTSIAGKTWLDAPLRLIGHSRGGSLVGELAKNLGEKGVWVDQVTTLDPHPLTNEGLDGLLVPGIVDAPMATWSNVAFWDNYWEDAFWYPHGESVSGAHNVQLASLDGGYPASSGGDHSDIHLWYHGTVDISSTVPYDGAYFGSADWYAGGQGPQDRAGFYYSSIAEGQRPADGVPATLGGGAGRRNVDLTNAVWPNIIGLAMVNPNSRVEKGNVFPVTYWCQDYDSGTVTTYFLDSDKNPYNGNEIQAGQTIDGQPRANLAPHVQDVGTAAAEAGTYYVFAAITDGSRTRYVYAPGTVTVVSPGRLGTVDFLDRPFPGDSWYRLRTAHDAILTVESLGPGVQIELFDAGLAELVAGPRVDWPAEAGQLFYFHISGTTGSTALRVANLVKHEAAAIAVYGTAGADQFIFDASAVLRQISINEVAYAFPASQAISFAFHGAGGNDEVRLTGGAGEDMAQLRPGRAVLNGGGYLVTAVNIESAIFDGSGGKDIAILHGGRGADTLTAGGEAPGADPQRAALNGNGVSLMATAETIYAYGHGGRDTAYLYESRGNDVFEPFWRWSRMRGDPDASVEGDEYYRRVAGFRDVIAHGNHSAKPQSFADERSDSATLVDAAIEDDYPPPDDVFALAQSLWVNESDKTRRQASFGGAFDIDNLDRALAFWGY